MNKIVVILISTFLLIASASELNSILPLQDKLIGGVRETNLDLSFVAVLTDDRERQFCSGVVISAFHVLSAAFCIKPYKDSLCYYNVRVITAYRVSTVLHMEYHDRYTFCPSVGSAFDIGVITTTNTRLQGLSLTTYDDDVVLGDNVMLATWDLHQYLRMNLTVVDNVQYCPEIYVSNWRVGDRLFCARPGIEFGTIIQNDIGAPVIKGNELVGIVSVGYVNYNDMQVSAFTRITDHLIYIGHEIGRTAQ